MQCSNLLETKREEVLRIAREHGATSVRVFGSVARGEVGKRSDIDLLVEMEPQRSLLDHVALIQDLEDLLGCGVHVVTAESVHWYIREQVGAEAVPL